jgi:hypothetical protein
MKRKNKSFCFAKTTNMEAKQMRFASEQKKNLSGTGAPYFVSPDPAFIEK